MPTTIGPALGSALYVAGGFLLPFLVVGCWCLFIAVCIVFAIPSVKADEVGLIINLRILLIDNQY
jgi:hypothetical protein